MNDDHLLPQPIKDIGQKLVDGKISQNERFFIIARLEAIKVYCENILRKYSK